MNKLNHIFFSIMLVISELCIVVAGFYIIKSKEPVYVIALASILFLILCLHCSYELYNVELYCTEKNKKISKLNVKSMLKNDDNSETICFDEYLVSAYKAYCTAIVEV